MTIRIIDIEEHSFEIVNKNNLCLKHKKKKKSLFFRGWNLICHHWTKVFCLCSNFFFVHITGKLWVFKAILDSVESRPKLADMCSRLIVPRAAFIDLLFLFAPRRMTAEKYSPEYFDRMKVRFEIGRFFFIYRALYIG